MDTSACLGVSVTAPKDRDVYMKFFPADWRGDESLASCSLAARGLWIELMCLAHKHGGYVRINGQCPALDDLAQVVRAKSKDVRVLLEELKAKGVCSIADEDGAVYSRRMVRDARRRQTNRENGSHGGNPILVQSVHVSDNRHGNREGNQNPSKLELELEVEVKPEREDAHASVNRGGAYRPVNPHTKPTNLIDGSAQRDHGSHAWCYYERDGFCVPQKLHRDLVGKFGVSNADTVLRTDFYPRVMAEFGQQPCSERLFDFWEKRFGQWLSSRSVRANADSDKAKTRALLQEFHTR